MKKLALTIAIVLGMTFGATAQYYDNNGLFGRGETPDGDMGGAGAPMLPGHGAEGNQDANQGPIGSGALLLIGFGAAYAMSKRKK